MKVIRNTTVRASLDQLDRRIAERQRPLQGAPTMMELILTLATTLFMAPFVVVTFSVIPMMGQITVGFSVLVTSLYLYYRKSLLVVGTAVGGSLIFWSVLFVSIQTIKNSIGIPLFFFTALGIPVCVLYTMFVGTRIWTIRGGIEE
jgi:hypothetical protein